MVLLGVFFWFFIISTFFFLGLCGRLMKRARKCKGKDRTDYILIKIRMRRNDVARSE